MHVKPLALLQLALSGVSTWVWVNMVNRLPETVDAGHDPMPGLWFVGTTSLLLIFGALVAQRQD
jgi:hypothetical protein